MYLKRYIAKVNTWSEFKEVLSSLSKLEKGKTFEELTKYFLYYHPVYKSKLKHVWLQHELTPTLLKKLGLPKNDQGIDLIAETNDGNYWAIQCKYLQNEDKRLSHRSISTFVSLSKGIAKHITYCLVCTTLDDYATLYKGKENIGFCTSDEWRKLDKTFFDWLRNKLSGKEKQLLPFKPKPHQTKALKEAKNYFIKENNHRGKLVFPCGAGKSLTGYWISRELKSKKILVAVPSLSLVKQTLEVYLRESVANKEDVSWLCVCSDEGIGKNDDVTIHTNEIGVPCVTDKKVIADWLIKNKNRKTIIFSTYQSGKTIADACKAAKHVFDLGIMDEAHKTVGDKTKLFSHLLFDSNAIIHKRVFMTATERRYAGSSDTVLSMDDTEIYGETFAQLSFKEAIEIGILSDYKIVTLFISNEEVKKLIDKNAYVKPSGKEWDKETEARTLASLIALRKAMVQYPIHHAVTFHSSIKKAEAFEQSQELFSKVYPKFGKVQSYHVSGAMPTSVRGKVVDEFAASNKAIITNAKCLTEGVDVPNIDCVLFADPRKSAVDIVQAVGRALRKKEGKEYGYVLLPVFTNHKSTEEIIESDEFKEILTTLRSLAANDERIIEYFKDISKGNTKSKKDALISFDIDEKIAMHINAKELIETVELRTWNKLAKLSWMPFEEARAFVRSLGLKNVAEWEEFSKSAKKPADIPATPRAVYLKNGWKGIGDWLGTFVVANQNKRYLPFEQAKSFVRNLNLNGQKDWFIYSKSAKKPENIPGAPHKTYENQGWISYGDWLGTGNVSSHNRTYISFIEARKFVHSLKLNSQREWRDFIKSSKFPNDIPKKPERVYKYSGWSSVGDWLGSGNIAPQLKQYLNFEDARQFVRNLNFEKRSEWIKYCTSSLKPDNIPSSPEKVYKKKGWLSMSDWIGVNLIATYNIQYREFNEARKFVHALNLKNQDEWKNYCKSGNKPPDIPNAAHRVYKNNGWISLGDWLGNERIATRNITYKPFGEARDFARKLKLSSQKKWFEFCKSEDKPSDIPRNAYRTYKNKGWKGWSDFLGTKKMSI